MGGNTVSIEYAVPISPKIEGETPVYRFPAFKDQLHDSPDGKLKTMKEVVKNSFAIYAANKMLGKIVREDEK